MQTALYSSFLKSKTNGKKQFVVLIDPDKFGAGDVLELANEAAVDLIMIGGSLLTNGNFEKCTEIIRQRTRIPLVIFPGNGMQISRNADGILLLSLISGRNAEMLIGNHVVAAPALRASGLEILPTGYMLIESGTSTAALYMSNTTPIPHHKPDIAMCTALAGQMLGLKLIYMDAGSGAKHCVSEEMIRTVSTALDIPLIVGGGINSAEKARTACAAGADMIVVGNAIEQDKSLLKEIATVVHSF